jgi:hypothetical protein
MSNVGPIERGMRVLAGLALLALAVVGPRTLWGLVGVVPLVTGLMGYCPLYRLMGISTCPPRPGSSR